MKRSLIISALWPRRAGLLLLWALIAFVFTWPAFQNFDNWGIQDWDQHLFYHSVPAISLLEYGQFPLWNPYHGGGAPALGNPQSVFLSPVYLAALLFGAVHGLKIEIWLHLVIGLAGAYWLGRERRLDRISALLVSFVFMLSSMFVLVLAVGMTTFLSIALIPWLVVLYLRAYRAWRYGIWAGLICALMFFGGGIYPVVLSVTFIVLHAGVSALLRAARPIAALKVLGIILAFSLGLGAIKIAPSLEFMLRHVRPIDDYSGYSIGSLWYSLTGREQTIAVILRLPLGEPGFWHGFSYFFDENGMYVGLVPLALCLLGMAARGRRDAVLIICLAIFVWISFGDRIPISLWAALHELPPYDSMRVAQRFRFVYMLLVALFAGCGLQTARGWVERLARRPWLGQGVAIVSVLAILCDLIAVNAALLRDAFTILPVETTRSAEFYQVTGFASHDKENAVSDGEESRLKAYYRRVMYQAEGGLYPALLSNVGTIHAYEPVPLPKRAIPRDSPDYRGEVYLDGAAGAARFAVWSPNRLVIETQAAGPGYVVVNQNYDPGWRLRGLPGRRIEPVEGLLAVQVGPDDHRFEMNYMPASFVAGASVTAVSFLLGLAFMLKGKRRLGRVCCTRHAVVE
jgi:hypothetical protein